MQRDRIAPRVHFISALCTLTPSLVVRQPMIHALILRDLFVAMFFLVKHPGTDSTVLKPVLTAVRSAATLTTTLAAPLLIFTAHMLLSAARLRHTHARQERHITITVEAGRRFAVKNCCVSYEIQRTVSVPEAIARRLEEKSRMATSPGIYKHIHLLIPGSICLLSFLLPLSVPGTEETQPSAPQSSVTDMQPWEHWKTEEGWPLDRRLLKRVSIWSVKITMADLLTAAQEQTKVQLSVHEPELQSQKLTIFAKRLGLNALMFQLSQLLGLFWYQREGEGQIEYMLTYGSSPPELRSAPVVEHREFEEQEQRAQRIADFIEALSLSEEELMGRARDDPMLVGSMLRRRDTRAGAEILAYVRPESLRPLIRDGHVLLGIEDMPAWVEAGLRRFYVNHYAGGKRLPRGLSEEMFLKQFRLFIVSRKPFTPADGVLYDMVGGDWQGFGYGAGFLGEEENHVEDPGRPGWIPKDFVAYSFLPFLLLEDGNPDFHLHVGWLPGKGSVKMVQRHFPDLIGESKSPDWFFYKNLQERRKQREEKLKDSPWKDDAKLSQKPQFPVKEPAAWKRATELLQATADQTGYCVLGTYFEEHDAFITNANPEEPLFMLLNRAAADAACTWALAGRVLRWRHNDWFVLEAKRTGDQ